MKLGSDFQFNYLKSFFVNVFFWQGSYCGTAEHTAEAAVFLFETALVDPRPGGGSGEATEWGRFAFRSGAGGDCGEGGAGFGRRG